MKTEELEKIFTYHSPKGTQTDRYIAIRETVKSAADIINQHCPESREKALAITSLQQASMWANASIAIHES